MIPGLSTSKPAKPAVKRKTFGTNRLAPGAILPSKKELIAGEKASNTEELTTSSDGEANCASNGTSEAASGKKHGLESGGQTRVPKKQKTVDYEEEQLETPDRDRFTFAVVCACNMNRSMAAHKIMQEEGYKVQSFGTARQVCCRNFLVLFSFFLLGRQCFWLEPTILKLMNKLQSLQYDPTSQLTNKNRAQRLWLEGIYY